MAGIFTRKSIAAIMADEALTPEERTDQIFSLYGRALDDGYITKSAAQAATDAAVEQAKAGFKPIDPTATDQYRQLLQERDMLRAIGGEEFAGVKPKFREQVFGMLDRGEKAEPIAKQLESIQTKYEEYFTPKSQEQPKPQFGAPTHGSMPKGEEGTVATLINAWGFAPKK